jgi:fermentation-respiration switch protein FrsA (DUF1100 family)
MGLKPEEVRLASFDGTSLHGWYVARKTADKKPKALIFFAHGNGENLTSHFVTLSFVLEHGYDFFIFDYRGYGKSGGESPKPKEAVGDTIAALRWADARAKEMGVPLIAFGQSLGSALLLRSLIEEKERVRPRLIVLESSFISFEWAAASVLSQNWITTIFQPLAFFLISDEWAPGPRIRELAPTPLLIFHGDADRVVDYKLGQRVYDAALHPKEFVRVRGGGHIRAFWGDNRVEMRQLFLDRLDTAIKTP